MPLTVIQSFFFLSLMSYLMSYKYFQYFLIIHLYIFCSFQIILQAYLLLILVSALLFLHRYLFMLILWFCLFARLVQYLCAGMILKIYYNAWIWHSYLFRMWILLGDLFLQVMNSFVILVFILIKSVALYVIRGLFFLKNLVVICVLKPSVLHDLFFVLF